MTVPNRAHAETIELEAELNNKSSVRDIGETLGVDYVLTGDITKTSTAFALNI
jgi:curli biogenesis system outer membrane secretion channel CsgG